MDAFLTPTLPQVDTYDITCWIGGCSWVEQLPMDVAQASAAEDFDDVRTAHMWSRHTPDEMTREVQSRIDDLAQHPEYLQEQREDRVAIIRLLRHAALMYPPDDIR